MPVNILNLSAYEVLSVEHDDHDYHLNVDVIQPMTHCPHCHSDRPVGFWRREQLVRDLPMHGRRVGMYTGTRRLLMAKDAEAVDLRVNKISTIGEMFRIGKNSSSVIVAVQDFSQLQAM